VEDYRRELDLDTAIARTTFVTDGVRVLREVFASPVDQALVVRLSTDRPGGVSFTASLSRPADAETRTSGPDRIVLNGCAAEGGVRFEARLRAVPEGGSVSTDGASLRIEGADAVTLLLTAATDYRGVNPTATCTKQLARAGAKSFERLRADHVAEHQRLFRRVTLDLGGDEAARAPTDERLEAVRQGASDPDLIALYFQFGRYLLIGCSRPGTMPSNLQGLWADGLEPPWNSDYHININIQMNYWPAEVCNLAECHEPFLEFVDALRPNGRKTAREVYGCGGFVAHHTPAAWLFTDPIGAGVYGLWPLGVAWCAQHHWEHYAFSRDLDYLRESGYPVMREAAEFFLDFLVEDPRTGLLVSGPSASPENAFRTADGQVSHIAMGCTMDQMSVEDLCRNCIEASELLDTDAEFRARLIEARSRLAPPRIASDGRIMEWPEEFEEPEPGHRHVSHLFGLHPGRQITLGRTPQLATAARATLDYRLAHGGGHTGWSRAWVINFLARLRDGAACEENLRSLLANSTHPNLFDNHPPFQIDGNFGGAAGIVEMLMQSRAGEIELLPALPPAWPEGRVTGLRARGGFEVDVQWRGGALVRAVVRSERGGSVRLRHGDTVREISLDAGGEYVWDGQ